MAATLPTLDEIEALFRRVVREELAAANRTAPEDRGFQRINPRTTRNSALCLSAGHCEACGWDPPPVDRRSGVLNVHHVVPRAAGGSEERENLLVLCPNCHALAHRLTFIGKRGGRYVGPESKERLLELLRSLREAPDDFRHAEAPFLESLRISRGDDL